MTIVVVCVADSAAELVAKARSLSAKACVTALCEDDSCPCAGEDRIVRIGRLRTIVRRVPASRRH